MKRLDIYGDIGSPDVDARALSQEIAATGEPIELHINSMGGSVFDGYAIAAAVQRHGQVTAIIDGVAASIAAYIAANAARVVMTSGALMMIHQPAAASEGTADDHRDTAAVLDKIQDELISVFAKRLQKKKEEAAALLRAETWYSAEEAVAAGLADAIEGRAAIGTADDGRALNFGGKYKIVAIAKDIPKPDTRSKKPVDARPVDPLDKAKASGLSTAYIDTRPLTDLLRDKTDLRIAYNSCLRAADLATMPPTNLARRLIESDTRNRHLALLFHAAQSRADFREWLRTCENAVTEMRETGRPPRDFARYLGGIEEPWRVSVGESISTFATDSDMGTAYTPAELAPRDRGQEKAPEGFTSQPRN